MARPTALDLVPLPKHVKLEKYIDLDSYPDNVMSCATKLEDEDDDDYVQDIPGVMTFGIKRARLNHTAPAKFQTVTPWTTNRNLLPKKLEFSATEKPKPITTFVNSKGDMCGMDSGKTKREEKAEQKGVTNQESLRLFESLHEQISAQKLEFANNANGLKEANEQKEGLIVRLEKDVSALKHSLLEQSREKEGLSTRHDREIAAVKEELNREIEGLKDSLREQNAEKEGLINRHKREIEDLKTSFSIEKALIEDRHRQQTAAYRSAILTVVLSQTQNQEAQSSVVQVTKERTSGGVGKQ